MGKKREIKHHKKDDYHVSIIIDYHYVSIMNKSLNKINFSQFGIYIPHSHKSGLSDLNSTKKIINAPFDLIIVKNKTCEGLSIRFVKIVELSL